MIGSWLVLFGDKSKELGLLALRKVMKDFWFVGLFYREDELFETNLIKSVELRV